MKDKGIIMNIEIFTNEFTQKVMDTLNTECPKGTGQRITRADLVEKLGLDKAYEPMIGVMIKDQDAFDDWGNFKGVGGGIGRLGETPPKKSSNNSGPTVSDEFAAELKTVLQRVCTEDGNPVPRRVIAEELGEPGSHTEALISAALKLDDFKDVYETVRGKAGGIRLIEANTEPESSNEDNDAQENTSEDTVPGILTSQDVEDDVTAGLTDYMSDDEDLSEAM